MKQSFLLSVLTFITISCFCQNAKLDSLSIKNSIGEAKKLRASSLDESKILFEKAYADAKTINYPKGEYAALTELGITEHYSGNYIEAIDYYRAALEVAKKNAYNKEIGRAYLNIAVALTFKGDYFKSTKEYLNSLNYSTEINDTLPIITSYQNLGLIYLDLEQFDKAETYGKKALDYSIKIKDSSLIGQNSINLIEFYLKTKNYDSAYKKLENIQPLVSSLKDKSLESYYYLKLGEYYEYKEQFQEALKFALKADNVSFANKTPHEKAYIYYVIGSIYYNLKDYDNSEKYYLKSKIIANETKSLGLLVNTSSGLYQLYANEERYKKAYQYADLYIRVNDSVRSEKNSKLIREVNAKYETERKDKELIAQDLELQKQTSELQEKKSQNMLMTGLTIFLLLATILTWFLFQQRQKRKNQEILTLKREQQVKTLESLMEGEEKERLRIAQELHDGINVDLSSIKYKLTSLLEQNNKVINEAVEMIDKSCEQVRAISHDLVPPSLKNFSLVDAIKDFCATKNNLHEPEISFDTLGESIPISKKAEVNIFRILQEIVNNSIKHSQASEIHAQLSYRDDEISLTVEDNGIGFKKDEVTSGIGLQNIQSRIEYLNANLDFRSDEKGTSYEIDINLEDLV